MFAFEVVVRQEHADLISGSLDVIEGLLLSDPFLGTVLSYDFCQTALNSPAARIDRNICTIVSGTVEQKAHHKKTDAPFDRCHPKVDGMLIVKAL